MDKDKLQKIEALYDDLHGMVSNKGFTAYEVLSASSMLMISIASANNIPLDVLVNALTLNHQIQVGGGIDPPPPEVTRH